jgi:predicted O-methyltransferase YrrM
MGLEHLEALWRQVVEDQKMYDFGADNGQIMHLAWLARQPGMRRVAEIGFNCGYSSYAFLAASPQTKVVSFDLMEFEYCERAKAHIDEEFPGRHQLVRGSSQQTVARYHKQHPDRRFDLIFIDGNHTFMGAFADLLNMKMLSTERTVVVMDDLTPWKVVGMGPTLAWQEAIRQGLLEPGGLFRDGEPVATIEPPGNRLWGVARFI